MDQAGLHQSGVKRSLSLSTTARKKQRPDQLDGTDFFGTASVYPTFDHDDSSCVGDNHTNDNTNRADSSATNLLSFFHDDLDSISGPGLPPFLRYSLTIDRE